MSHAALGTLLGHVQRIAGADLTDGLTDRQLLERFTSLREPAALAALVRRHGRLVLSACRQVLTDEADVEDAFQATFLVLLRKAGTTCWRVSVGSWLFGVAHRIAVRARADAGKRRRRENEASVRRAEAVEPTDLSWGEACAVLHAELDRLPDKFRLPLLLCYLDGKTRDEAAQQLGWSVGSVKGYLERGRKRLRARLERRGVVLSAGLLGTLLAPRTQAVTSQLVDSTLQSALLTTATPAGVAATGRAALLAHGVLQSMRTTQRIVLTVAVLLVGTVGTGVGLWAKQAKADKPGAPQAPPAAAQAKAEAAPMNPDEMVVVAGQVFDPDGRPVRDARLYTFRLKTIPPRSEDDLGSVQRGTTGSDGRFRFEATRMEVLTPIGSRGPFPVVAVADGFGVAWAAMKQAGDELTFRLVKDLPIAGRVVDTEGRPVAGAAVRVAAIYTAPPGQIDKFLTGWKADWNDALRQLDDRLYMPPVQVLTTATDRDGRFRVTGAGAERLSILEVKGPTFTKAMLYVVGRDGFDPKPYNQAAAQRQPPELRSPGDTPILTGPSLETVVTAGKVIEGTVRELGSGKPVAGARVAAYTGYNSGVDAVTDAQGRFKLSGLPKMNEIPLHAGPPDGSALLPRSIRVPDTAGLKPTTVDIDLARGVIVTGQVIDKVTGKGVAGGIRFVPLPENRFFEKPGYDSYKTERFSTTIDRDGRFRLSVIPGPGVLMVQGHGDETFNGKPINPYLPAVFDEEDRKQVKVIESNDGSRYFAAAGNTIEFLTHHHALKRLDLAEGSDPVRLELFVHRGRTLTVRVEDTDGRPLSGAVVSGMTASWPATFPLTGPECPVYGLDPAKPRTLVLYHPERKLGVILTLRGDEAQPPVAKLASAGAVTGRVLDAEGQPVAGAEVGMSYPDRTGSELDRFLRQQREPLRTDKNGQFRLEGIVPGLKFGLSIRKGQTFLVGKPRIGQKQVESGQTLDLGNLTTEPLRR